MPPMTTHKVSAIDGALLDAAVALAEGLQPGIAPYRVTDLATGISFVRDEPVCIVGAEHFEPSARWERAGPIIERERISLAGHADGRWIGQHPSQTAKTGMWFGATPLIAAMRAYVAWKFGEEVDLP